MQELEIYHSVSRSTDCFYPKSAGHKEPPQNQVQCHISASTIPCLPFFWKMEERDAPELLKKKGLATVRAELSFAHFAWRKKKRASSSLHGDSGGRGKVTPVTNKRWTKLSQIRAKK